MAQVFIHKGNVCEECGFEIVVMCCNGGVGKKWQYQDYMAYCGNKTCKNHDNVQEWGQSVAPDYLTTIQGEPDTP